MTIIDKIRKLYGFPQNFHFGFSESEIYQLEKRLNIKFPLKLKSYYLSLGKIETINYSHNRLLKPNKEIRFSKDRHLIFYEENQASACWGIKEKDLKFDNPTVWGNYGKEEDSDWLVETNSIDNFFLLMAVYNGTLGGLKYNANSLAHIEPKTVKYIEDNWTEIQGISYEKQKVYTDNFYEILSLSFDGKSNCNGIFIGTSNQKRFNTMIENIEINWSYISYED